MYSLKLHNTCLACAVAYNTNGQVHTLDTWRCFYAFKRTSMTETVHTKCFSTPRANEVTTSEARGDQCMHLVLPLTKTLPSPVIIDPLWAELSHRERGIAGRLDRGGCSHNWSKLDYFLIPLPNPPPPPPHL